MSNKRQQDILQLKDQEEEKKQPVASKKGISADFMLSQESIKQFEEAADHETKEERQKLREFEKQKKNFAFQLKNQSDKEFLDKQHQTSQQRIKFLLNQSEIFSHFILQDNGKNPAIDNGKKKGAEQDKQIGGKTSVSKRHSKRAAKGVDEDVDEESELVITRLQSQPSILKGGQLRDYQLDGLNWMIHLYERGLNGILADEMGLGKTIQTISLIAFLREFKHIHGYYLIIVPKSTIPNWMNEFKKWCPQVRVINLIARKEQREEILKNDLQPEKFDVILTTFEGCRLCMPQLNKFKWEYLIVDEAHKIKNEDSQISQKLRILKSRYRLLLTGTPLQNNLHELWSLLNFLLPDVFSSADIFDEWFDLGGGKNGELTDKQKEEKNTDIVQQLHKILRPFLLRRIKKEVEKNLPPKVEIHVSVGITEQQKKIYRQLLKKSTIEKGTTTSFYRNIIIQLRKICDHPYLFDGQEPDGADEFGEHLVTSCGKMLFLDKLLKKVKEDQSQVLIFSGFTSMLDILEDYCIFREYKYCRLDGNTELDDREKYIQEFTQANSEKFIFLISTRAGGLGLNLMTANIVVLYDSDWNPQIDLQAMDRAHRIGQTKIVKVFRLVTKNTMEEKLIEKQTMKLKLDNLIIQKGRLAPKHAGFQKEELQDMVNYGADAIFEVGSELSDGDIDELIKKGEEKALEIQRQVETLVKDKMNMIDFEMNTMNMYQFEDVDYLQEKRKEAQNLINKHVVNMLNEEVRGGRREKKMASMNLNESKLFPKFFQGGNIGISQETKKKKLLKVQDFRFFPNPDRLRYLLDKEMEAKYTSYLQGIELVVFTEEEKKEKEYLWSQGFVDWDRRDYQRFCQALEFCAKDDYDSISQHIQTKDKEEVERYAKVFFDKIDTLTDADKIKRNVDKAEKVLSFKQKAPEMIKTKVMAYESPLDEMIIYATQKSKYFSRESDIILLCLTHKYGYGKWREIKQAIRRDTRCRFDHLFLSRNEQEISRRVDILVKALEKEDQLNKKKQDDVQMMGENGGLNGQDMHMMQLNGQNKGNQMIMGRMNKEVTLEDDDNPEEDNENSQSMSSKLVQSKLKFGNKKKQAQDDATISDESMNEGDADNKFNYLKNECDLRIGGGQMMGKNSDDDSNQFSMIENKSKSNQKSKTNLSSDLDQALARSYPKKSKNASKKPKDDSGNSFKQTTLSFGSNKLSGQKRSEPEKPEDNEGDESDQGLDSQIKKQKIE